MPIRMCGASSVPMNGIVAPSAASSSSSTAATGPVRLAFPATPPRTFFSCARYTGRMVGPRASRSLSRRVRDLSSCGRSRAARRPTRAPPSGESSTQIRPPCSSTIERAIPRPRPLPPEARSRADSLRWKRSKTRSRSAAGMPGPSSSTRSPAVARRGPRGERDPAPRPGVAPGVGEQVADDLGDQVGVGAERSRRPARRARPDRGRRRAGRAGRGRPRSRSQRRPDPLVEPGEREQVLDQPLDPPHLGHRHAPRPAAPPRRVGLLLAGEDFELAADRGQRAAQLVRGVGDELALPGEGVVEAVEHVVERLGEGRELGRGGRARFEPWRQVPGVDLAGGRREPPQRRGGARGQEVAGEERRDERRPRRPGGRSVRPRPGRPRSARSTSARLARRALRLASPSPPRA